MELNTFYLPATIQSQLRTTKRVVKKSLTTKVFWNTFRRKFNKVFLVSAKIHLGHGLSKTISDLVVDCSSKTAAEQKYLVFLKNSLPEWKIVGRIELQEQI